jgi:hypothetical protein
MRTLVLAFCVVLLLVTTVHLAHAGSGGFDSGGMVVRNATTLGPCLVCGLLQSLWVVAVVMVASLGIPRAVPTVPVVTWGASREFPSAFFIRPPPQG